MRLLACVFLALLTIGWPATGATQSRETSPKLAGVWKGIYHASPSFMRVTLTVSDGDATTMSAQLRIERHRDRNPANVAVTSATVEYFPSSQSLTVMGAPTPTFGTMGFRLVYDAERRVFAGIRLRSADPGSPHVLLVREGDADRYLDKLLDVPDQGGAMRTNPLSIFGGAPSEEKLVAWTTRLADEYPAIYPLATPKPVLHFSAMSLFRDRYFEPTFGKPYDRVPERDFGRIRRRMEGIGAAGGADARVTRASEAARALTDAFSYDAGADGAQAMLLSVIALRHIEAWRDQTTLGLARLSARRGALAQLQSVNDVAEIVLGAFWPSERAAFATAIDRRRREMTDSLLTQVVTAAVAQTDGFRSAPALVSMRDVLRSPYPNDAPPARSETVAALAPGSTLAVRQAMTAFVQSRLSALASAEAVRDDPGSAPFPATGVRAIAANAAHVTAMRAKYAEHRAEPTVQSLLSHLETQRAVLLVQEAPALRSVIEAAMSEAALDTIVATYLYLPSDRGNLSGDLRLDEVERRRRGIQRRQAHVMQSLAAADSAAEVRMQRWRPVIAARRDDATRLLGTSPPVLDDLRQVLVQTSRVFERSTRDVDAEFLRIVRSIGFQTMNGTDELYARSNRFVNPRGHRLDTYRGSDESGAPFISVRLTVPAAPPAIIEYYAAQLRADKRNSSWARPEDDASPLRVVTKSEPHVRTGGTMYQYEMRADTLEVLVALNVRGEYAVTGERVAPDVVRVTPWTFDTDELVFAGVALRFIAVGSVTLGPVLGAVGPEGSNGPSMYRRDARFPLGSLIGRFARGDWFLIGAGTTVTAPANDVLQLRVNDNDPSNNDGAFGVLIERVSPARQPPP